LYAKLEERILKVASTGDTRLVLSIEAHGRTEHWYPSVKVFNAMRLQGMEVRRVGENEMEIAWLPYNPDLDPFVKWRPNHTSGVGWSK
jgi:hypothetical protein